MQKGVPALANSKEIEAFVTVMADPDRFGMNIEQIAEKFNMAPSTIYYRARDPEINKLIKQRRESMFKIELPKVDRGLRKKAFKGDVKAAELIYTRWDDYDPKANQINALIQVNITEKSEDHSLKADIPKIANE